LFNVVKNNVSHPDFDTPTLPSGLVFSDLYCREGLVKIDSMFLRDLQEHAPDLHARVLQARQDPARFAAEESEWIIELAPHLEDFVGRLFGIERELRALQARHSELAPLYTVKRQFVQRKAVAAKNADAPESIDGPGVGARLAAAIGEPLTELSFARHVLAWLDDEGGNASNLQLATQYARWAALSKAGQAHHRAGVLF
jgi:hypothetical protein